MGGAHAHTRTRASGFSAEAAGLEREGKVGAAGPEAAELRITAREAAGLLLQAGAGERFESRGRLRRGQQRPLSAAV